MCPERPRSAASHRRHIADDQVWQVDLGYEYVVDPGDDLGLGRELVGFLFSICHDYFEVAAKPSVVCG
jgi:hypothetical protein